MGKLIHIGVLAIGFLLTHCGMIEAQESHERAGTKNGGRDGSSLITLTNSLGTEVQLAEYGALLVSIKTKDREGNPGNICLSYASEEEARKGGVFGSVIGRFANRIDGGGFTIDGKRFELESVHPKTGVHIHGGKTGFHRQQWNGIHGVDQQGPFARFDLTSPDGHEGYPGEVHVSVTYRLTGENILRIEYKGRTDKATHLNLTNHAYFNLRGEGDILSHELTLVAEEYLELNEKTIPTGQLLPVEDSPFDFREKKTIGSSIEEIATGGYDHCFVLHQERVRELTTCAFLTDPESGRTLEVATTKPGVQVYTANHFKGNPFPKWGGICFETQFFPDTPNQEHFPSSLLRPEETYEHVTEFRFGVME